MRTKGSRHGAFHWFYLEEDLKQIAAAREAAAGPQTWNKAPAGADGWVNTREAAELCGCYGSRLWTWHSGLEPIPGGGELRKENRTVRNQVFSYWKCIDVEQIAAARKLGKRPQTGIKAPAGANGWLNTQEAAKLCACVPETLYSWGCGRSRVPGGGPLRKRQRTINGRPCFYWWKDHVQRIAQARGVRILDDQPASPTPQLADGQPESAAPQSAAPKKRRGRPRGTLDNDPRKDREVNEAWESKHYLTKADLGRAKNMSEREVRQAIWRHRARARKA
jgi:hypothetical protein